MIFESLYIKSFGKLIDRSIDFDSGVNILSVCSRFVSIENLALHSHAVHKTNGGVVYASETVYVGDGVRLVMHTGWDKEINHKSTLLYFCGTDNRIFLDHTGQTVWCVTADGQRHLMYRENLTERLVNQYVRVFQDFHQALLHRAETVHRKQVMTVHALLLCVGKDGIGSSVLPSC